MEWNGREEKKVKQIARRKEGVQEEGKKEGKKEREAAKKGREGKGRELERNEGK